MGGGASESTGWNYESRLHNGVVRDRVRNSVGRKKRTDRPNYKAFSQPIDYDLRCETIDRVGESK